MDQIAFLAFALIFCGVAYFMYRQYKKNPPKL
jgi:cbb3-type cytochrome oxidase subunit 3